MNREFFFYILRALTRRPHQLTAADTLICRSGSPVSSGEHKAIHDEVNNQRKVLRPDSLLSRPSLSEQNIYPKSINTVLEEFPYSV